MKNSFLVGVLFILSLVCQAQVDSNSVATGIIKGVVYSSDGLPASYVPVNIKGSSQSVTTDEEGKFQLTVSEGKHVLMIKVMGHVPEEKEIEVAAGQTTTVPDFKLLESSKELNEVEVQGKNEVQEVKESGFAVNVIETKQYANTNSDLNQVLNRSAGVRVREQGGLGSNYNFSINGLSGKQVKYFIDGIPMEVFGSSMTLNNIPVNLAERVEVYKGVVPVTLGSDAMGGAVNVITNQKVKKYLDASYTYGSFNTHRVAVTGQYRFDSTGLVIRASGFYNYSDNNYIMRGVEVWDQAQYKYIGKDFRRFHDHYKSGMGTIEVGFMKKRWADVFFVGASYSQTNQDIQTGFNQDVVYGKVTRHGYGLSGTARYRKDNLFVKGLNLNLFASRSIDHFVTVDTVLAKYEWDGTSTPTSYSERKGIKTLNNITRPKTFARASLGYELTPIHSFNLNYTLDNVRNESYNELLTDRDDIPGVLRKSILGLAYQQELAKKKWTNVFFGKYYGQGLEQRKYNTSTYQYEKNTRFYNNIGYGVASRYRIMPDLGVKLSFEKAYRLQEIEETFGDGLNTVPNTELKPEHSNNLNAGAFYGFNKKKHKFYLEAGGFFRNASDFIYAVPYLGSGALRYENKSKVRITGIEGEFRYSYSDLMIVSVNATYQQAINYTKYSKAGNTIPEATYLNKIPNQPWLFGNLDFSIGKNDLIGRHTRLQANWYTQYVHWFYLTWEAFGTQAGKSTIPDQYVHTASVTYSFSDGRYNVSFECRNLTNALAYDNFRLQKPGRAFFVKFRYFIKG